MQPTHQHEEVLLKDAKHLKIYTKEILVFSKETKKDDRPVPVIVKRYKMGILATHERIRYEEELKKARRTDRISTTSKECENLVFLYEQGVWNSPKYGHVEGFYTITDRVDDTLQKVYLTQELTWDRVLFFGKQIVSGLNYLHNSKYNEKGIPHMHLHSNNILVTANGTVKLADWEFNSLKQIIQEKFRVPTKDITTDVTPWKAPETRTLQWIKMFGKDPQNWIPANMWTFPVLLWEMNQRQAPTNEFILKNPEEHLALMTEWPETIKQGFLQIWKWFDWERPTSQQIQQDWEKIWNIQ